jgi:Rieske Fe-S protein
VTEPAERPIPVWKRDFPYTSEGEEGVTRREFTRFLVAASVAAAGGTGLTSVWASLKTVNTGVPTEIIALDEIEVAGSHLFAYPTPKDPAILLRPTADTVLGFSQKCTHLGCVVYWAPEHERLECPCHEGIFDLNGQPVAGPPERPLGRIEVEVHEGVVWAVAARGEAMA